MKIGLLIFLIIFSLHANAKKWLLDTTGLSPETIADIQKHFPQQDDLNLEKIDEIIRHLQQNPNSEHVQAIETTEGKIQLIVKFSKRIGQLSFKGARNVSESDLRAVFQINKGDIFDEQGLIDAGERLRQFYHDIGYLNTSIDIEYPSDENGKINVQVSITENKITEIESITIVSESASLNKNIESLLRIIRGRPLTETHINEIQRLTREALRKGYHLRAEISPPETKLNADETKAFIELKIENIESYSVSFNGNTLFSSRSLQEETLDLSNFHSVNPKLATELVDKIKSSYLANGYSRIEIQTQETEGKSPYSRRIEFAINEGPQVKIEKMIVSGRVSRSPDYYADFIRTHSSSLIKSGYYNKEDIDNGIKNTITELQNQGYLLAKNISTRSQYNREKNRITIFINIDEGPLTEIESIEFIGNSSIKKDELLAISELKSSGPLHLNQIEKAVQLIKTFYQERGYIEMSILNEKDGLVSYNDNNTKAKLSFKIQEGPEVRAGSILIDGNNFTKDFVILNELEFKAGDLLTLSKIDESVSRLQKTSFFNTVEIKTLEEKTSVSNRTVLIKVTERDPGIINFGVGATNERTLTFRGYTGAAYHNISGIGWGASARAELNYNVTDIRFLESKVTLGTVVPYLFNTRVRGRLNLTRSKTVTDYDLKKASEINQTTWSIEKDFTTHVSGKWDIISIATVHDFGLDPTKNIQDTLLDIGSTATELDIDFRNHMFNPTSGTLTRITAEYAHPLLRSSPTIHYQKATASFSHYWKISDTPIVWANSLRSGYLENLNHEPGGGVPYDKKGFILGGRSTIRGYEAASIEVFPNRIDLASDNYLLTTNASMGLLKSEFRFPVYGNFGMAVFYDAGYVSISGLDIADNFRDSTGFGLRYNTPVGPLNLEWGWKLRRRSGEDPWRFHLSIGTF